MYKDESAGGKKPDPEGQTGSSPPNATVGNFTCNISVTVNILCMLVGALTIVLACILFHNSFSGVIIPIYMIVFGVLVILWELGVGNMLHAYLGFYNYSLGRGLFYIFLGCLGLSRDSFNLVAGGFIIFVGVGFCVFQLLGWNPPPVFPLCKISVASSA